MNEVGRRLATTSCSYQERRVAVEDAHGHGGLGRKDVLQDPGAGLRGDNSLAGSAWNRPGSIYYSCRCDDGVLADMKSQYLQT